MNKTTKIVLWVILGLLILTAIVVPSVIFSLPKKTVTPKPKKTVSFSQQSGGLCRTSKNEYPSSTVVNLDINNCENMCSKDKDCIAFDTEMGQKNSSCRLYYDNNKGNEPASKHWKKGDTLTVSDPCNYPDEYSYCPKNPTAKSSSKIYNTKNYVCYIKKT